MLLSTNPHGLSAIVHKWPGAEISQHGDEIIWHDHSPVPAKSQDEIDNAIAEYVNSSIRGWASLRKKRNGLLVSSDWTQASDSPLTDEAKAEWATYRETLRNLPANTPDPDSPTWPTPPE
jgi:hypothetical protein